MDNEKPHVARRHHHILPDSTALTVGAALLVLTVVTVAVAHVELGKLNFLVAILVASLKASLVALFFMNLRYDRRENAVIFGTSFVFLAIFIVLTSMDLFFRGDVAVKGPLMAAPQARSKLVKPWLPTSELISRGKELYAQQCVSCHGPDGKGDGPAAGALVPPPRNFLAEQGWKNGRKPSQIFKTLKEGLPPSAMASYGTLPADDRWSLVHYVATLGAKTEADTPDDLARIGIDVTQAGGGEAKEAATIPVEAAMALMAQPEVAAQVELAVRPAGRAEETPAGRGARIYADRCVRCHGAGARGGVFVSAGLSPRAVIRTRPLDAQREGMKSIASFREAVAAGLPGGLMPGSGDLGSVEVEELYQYVGTLGR